MTAQFDYERLDRTGKFIPGAFSVMFIDIVRFTKYGDNQALRDAVRVLHNAINDILIKVEWDRESRVNPNGAIMMPTGDGYGIGFEPSLVSDREVLNYAVEVSNKMKGENRPIRIGISKGSCYIHQDLNNTMNLCGWGVIDAERTMSFGGRNHILCEKSFAKLLLDHQEDPNLHAIGEYRAKHGRALDIYNYYSKNFGDKQKPKRQ